MFTPHIHGLFDLVLAQLGMGRALRRLVSCGLVHCEFGRWLASTATDEASFDSGETKAKTVTVVLGRLESVWLMLLRMNAQNLLAHGPASASLGNGSPLRNRGRECL